MAKTLEQYTQCHSKVVTIGIIANLIFIAPLILFPACFLQFLGVHLDGLIWARVSGFLLLLVSILYIPAVINLDRYRVNAWLAIFPSRTFGTVFFAVQVFIFDQPGSFLIGSLVDITFASLSLYYLVRITVLELNGART